MAIIMHVLTNPCSQSPTGDVGNIGDIAERNRKRLCQGGKPGTCMIMWLRPQVDSLRLTADL